MIKNKLSKLDVNLIASNKRAKYEYFIVKEFEAGLVLLSWEVKSLRFSSVNISNSYVIIKNKTAYLFGANIRPSMVDATHTIFEPNRSRKLLLKQHELDVLSNHSNQKGYTIVAISLYWKFNWCKIKIGIAKGKKKYDKRSELKAREWKRNKDRMTKNANY